jgi:sulfatase maturation enzyme AslB (radical SAM superfamily)
VKFKSFTFKLTDACNFRCSYCEQKRGINALSFYTIKKAIDFFLPYFDPNCWIYFYGGEPLLTFNKIRTTVDYLKDSQKNSKFQPRFGISTNGSLIDEDMLYFFNDNEFAILLSFDGFAQDITRRKGSYQHLVTTINEILRYPGIHLRTNSVFTADTVTHLSKSLQMLADMGIPNIDFSLSAIHPWDRSSLIQLKDELKSLREFLFMSYQRTKEIPINYFRGKQEEGLFICLAGRDRMTLTPDEKLWGCHIFPNLIDGEESFNQYREYCFGNLDAFMDNHEVIYPEILRNLSELRMDRFCTSETYCLFCSDIYNCGICPVYAAISSGALGRIPVWMCEIKRMKREERSLFWKEIGDISTNEKDGS